MKQFGWFLFDAITHVILTAVICAVFSYALRFSFSIDISWLKVLILWYASYLMLNHYKQNLKTDQK